jgi:hypothetical protein
VLSDLVAYLMLIVPVLGIVLVNRSLGLRCRPRSLNEIAAASKADRARRKTGPFRPGVYGFVLNEALRDVLDRVAVDVATRPAVTQETFATELLGALRSRAAKAEGEEHELLARLHGLLADGEAQRCLGQYLTAVRERLAELEREPTPAA